MKHNQYLYTKIKIKQMHHRAFLSSKTYFTKVLSKMLYFPYRYINKLVQQKMASVINNQELQP